MKVRHPTAPHTHTIIFLHGRDSTAREFASELFESQATDGWTLPEALPGIKWVFPTAEMMPPKRFGGEMSQWFDMHTTEDPHELEAEQDMSASNKRIQDIIATEAAIVGAGKVVLGGISQGCAVAIHALLAGNIRLGGFIGVSSWLPRPNNVSCELTAGLHDQAAKTPVLLCHSKDDETIEIRFGKELNDTLVAGGMQVQWCAYPDGGHWINEPQGVDDIVAFVSRVV
ncbi:hypothetical protein B0A48_10575 [Cryoendolithus antarcticus]|uniref:Phospholipase/carboxylesterase/thioesterase domain-containing protein n=1 Tax=Cryoendolithus antarcticus TaxID=1507870 RepID=A0A1V8SXP4_9PEZI|nr:hypothetical protein B0A48_10575 [Cryoendolithus antarcticus]